MFPSNQVLKYIVCFAFICCAKICHGQNALVIPDGTFYIVRHAEKDTGNDPRLSTMGQARAGDLYRILKNKKIQKIYTTKYRRTKMTGDSLRVYQNIDTAIYMADTTGYGIAEKLTANQNKKISVLIIGHSNTVPIMIRKLGVQNYVVTELSDNTYDMLFVVKRKKGKAVLQQLKYGQPSPTSLEAHLKMN